MTGILNNIWSGLENLPRNILDGQSPQNFSGVPFRGIDKTGQRIAQGTALAEAGGAAAGAAGDTIGLWTYQNSGGAINTEVGTTVTWLCAALITTT